MFLGVDAMCVFAAFPVFSRVIHPWVQVTTWHPSITASRTWDYKGDNCTRRCYDLPYMQMLVHWNVGALVLTCSWRAIHLNCPMVMLPPSVSPIHLSSLVKLDLFRTRVGIERKRAARTEARKSGNERHLQFKQHHTALGLLTLCISLPLLPVTGLTWLT